jgi:uncharacterized protein YcbX
MNVSEPVGTIRALWRFPVKSMLGEQLEAVDLSEGGIVGDRAYALRDRETGKVASAKHPKLWPNLRELEPLSRFDARRFRMNVIVDTPAHGFVENEWLGRTLAIGDDVRIGVALPDPRCVMPSLAQEDLPKDSGILKALARHNRIDVAGARYPCAGIYAVAEATGTIRRDDRVSLV